jgi:hypothetical protein
MILKKAAVGNFKMQCAYSGDVTEEKHTNPRQDPSEFQTSDTCCYILPLGAFP